MPTLSVRPTLVNVAGVHRFGLTHSAKDASILPAYEWDRINPIWMNQKRDFEHLNSLGRNIQ